MTSTKSKTSNTVASKTAVETAVATAAKVKAIADAAKAVLIDMDDAIDALATAICAGEHVIFLGPPGTAKSTLARFFADSMELTNFRVVLNPDTTREDLVGAIDPVKLTQGTWERKWARLACADFALLDEIGKASGQVQNMLLDILEERMVTSDAGDCRIPLHTAVAASNETIDDQPAVWDRFVIRALLSYIVEPSDFVRMLQSDIQPHRCPISREELSGMSCAAYQMSLKPKQDVSNAMVTMWTQVSSYTAGRVSDRRWKRMLRVAAGNALLNGRGELEQEDLAVAKWVLWNDVEEIDAIRTWSEGVAFAGLQEVMEQEALLDELRTQAAGFGKVDASNMKQAAQVNFRASKLRKLAEARKADAKNAGLRERWSKLAVEAGTIAENMIS